MSSFLQSLVATLEPLGLADRDVLVGVSGGADSVSLLCGLHSVGAPSRIRLSAAHLNHGLRGSAADDDAAWTGALCRRLGVPIVVEQVDVRGRAEAESLNIEEAARTVRYEFLERTARDLGCTHVAVAHTEDDRIETVLHHLLRGTGLAGLRGMPPSRPLADGIELVRPLLKVRRPAIEDWLAEIGQEFRRDATNADESRTRNRIRHGLLPFLERAFGPQVRGSILRAADQASEMQLAFAQLAERLLDRCLTDDSPGVCRLDCRMLDDQPCHLVREVFVALWKQKNWPRQQMGFGDWDRLYRLVKEGGAATLPGNLQAIRRGSLIVIQRQ